MLKKIVPPLLVAFTVYFVIKNPGQAAGFVHSFVSGTFGFATALAASGGQ